MLILAFAAGLIALGAISLRQMPNEVIPELASGPVLEVQTEAPGLSSEEVEQYLTVPLENNLLDGIMGVWDVRSDSIAGLSKVDLYFEPGTGLLQARQLVEERLTNAFSLPNVAKPPSLIQPLSTSSRALMIGLRSRTLDPLELSYLARWIVKPRLAGVPGVANVVIFGQKDRQIQVQVDPKRLARHHVTLSQVIDTTGNSQLVSPLTYLQGSSPGTGGFLDGPNQRLDIRPVLPLGTPRKLASLPIGGASTKLSLGRVARVVQGHQPLIGNALIGGSPGLVLLVQKLPSASLIGVTNGVQRALSDLRPALPGVRIATSFFRPATYLSDSLHNLALGIVLAAVLGLIALAALLLEFRMAFVAALSIALSLIGALLVLQWLGQTLNALVVLGLLMASAVLVDDALGAAYELLRSVRHSAQRAGGPPLQATLIESLARLRGTMGYATIAVLLTIAPVFFSSGLTARYLHPMVLSLALAVITSAVIALTVTPALGMLVLERRSPRRAAAPPLADRIAAVYERMVRRATSVPIAVLGVVTLAGVAGIVSIPFLHQPAPPRFKDRNLVVQWSGPAGAGLGEMDRVTDRAMRELRALPAVAAVAATLGRAVGGDRIVDPSSGQIYIALKASANYDRALSEVRQIVLGTPGIEASVSTDEAERQAGVLAPAGDAVVVRVYGEDYERLDTIATRVQRAIATTPGLERPRVQGPSREPNIEVAIDDAAARRAGVLPGDARRQASALVSGLTVGNFFQDQAVFDVVVIGTPAVRRTVRDIGSLLIDTAHGGTVRLSRIAHVAVRPYPIDIRHQALSRYVDVVAPVRSGSAAAARAGVQTALGRMRFPLDYRAEVLGPTPEAATSHGLFVAFIIAAAVGIVLLLQAALSSWGLAAAMFLTLPVSLAGGLIVALATGQASSLAADAGLLAVLAFALRQGTAQVVTIRRLQGVHGSRLDRNVIARASLTRLAPSLAAAAVTATVMLPFIALGGNVAGNEITHTAAVVILGGLVSATLWTHLLLPAVCFVLAPPTPPPAEGELDVLIQQSTNGASAKTGAGEAFDSDNSSPSVQTLF